MIFDFLPTPRAALKSALLLGATFLGQGCAQAQPKNAQPQNAPSVALQTTQSREWPLGMASNTPFFGDPTYPQALLNTGVNMVRLDVGFHTLRPMPDPNPASWNWKPLEQMRAIKARHPKIEFLALLGYSTAWAAEPRLKSENGLSSAQRGADVRPVESPENLYGHYVYEVVKRNKDFITHWESWNEPDLPGHHFFNGNGADFLPYQRAAYLAAKKADPNCKVLFAGLSFAAIEGYLNRNKLHAPTIAPPQVSFFEEYLQAVVKDPKAAKHNYYFDIMSQHTYSRASDAYDYTRIVQKAMRDHLKQEKPVWLTETGFNDDNSPFGGSPDEYGDYLLQSFAWAKSAGVEKIFHFQLDNSNNHGLYKGMLGEPKRALISYREVLAKELAPARFVAQKHGSKGVGMLEGNRVYQPKWKTGHNLFEFRDDAKNRRIFVAWADSARPVTIQIPAQSANATLVDRLGLRRPLTAKNGVYEVALPGATNQGGWPRFDDPKAKAMGEPENLVGGTTQILIEELAR